MHVHTPATPTVLVVDDIAVNRDLVRTILGYEGYDVIEAESGGEALPLPVR